MLRISIDQAPAKMYRFYLATESLASENTHTNLTGETSLCWQNGEN